MVTDLVCSTDSLAAGEPLIGSAPTHTGWLCLEQAGPWGRKALTQSKLDPDIGATLEERAATVGIRPTLIRRSGRNCDAEDADTSRPWLLLAHTSPAGAWLVQRRLDDPAEVLDVDLAALAAGDRSAFPGFTDVAHEMLFVCTNGKRDTCCARLGRPVSLSAAAAYPGRVWEITHTSGHRFAPTTVLLPSGHLHGRVLDGGALLAAADRGELVTETWRGRSTWPADAQAAEDVVRRDHAITGLHDLSVAPADDDWLVTHPDGRSWRLRVEGSVSGERAESCGKDPVPVVHRMTRQVG